GWASEHAKLFALRDTPRRTDMDGYGLWIGSFLARIGPVASGSVPQLVACLAHPAMETRGAAIRALGSIGPPAHDAPATLMDIAASDRLGSYPRALPRAIARIAGDSKGFVDQLATTLSGDSRGMEGAAAVLDESRAGRIRGLDAALESLSFATEPRRIA